MKLSPSSDELYNNAVYAIKSAGIASTAALQKALLISYGRACELMERMEREGVVSKQLWNGKRSIIG